MLTAIAQTYPFRANDYYLGLIDWSDPNDPIRQLVIPRHDDLLEWGQLDVSNERSFTVVRGVQHKYPDTALLLCSQACGAYCRYCFRKRLFMGESDEATPELGAAIRYISQHPEINDVLLTGGDPLMLKTRRLTRIFQSLHAIPHVRVIRIGSKMPAFNPFRIVDDAELQAAFRRYSDPTRRMYLITHFDHPRELTDVAVEAIARSLSNGLICANQCPLIKGVNDDPEVLAELYSRLARVGCPPYYLFQIRPVTGNKPYVVPIVRAWHIFQAALARGSGLARRTRYVISHATGKMEVLGVDRRHIYMRYHRAVKQADAGRVLVFRRDDEAYWPDQLERKA
jgi:KamA family protein